MSNITKSARGETCLVRVPGVCNHNRETTVFAHLNGGGMAYKSIEQDLDEGAYCCSDCHTWLDGGYTLDKRYTATRETRDLLHLEGFRRTLKRLIAKGLILIIQ